MAFHTDVQDGVAELVLDNPPVNALDSAGWFEYARLIRELGIDPIEFRLNNAAREGTQTVYGVKFKRIGMVEVLEAIKAHPHYQAPLGPNQGRGVAAAFWLNAGMQSSAAVTGVTSTRRASSTSSLSSSSLDQR